MTVNLVVVLGYAIIILGGKMDKIIPTFKKTLFDASLGDVLVDMTEMGIDSLLDEGVLQSIPIVKLFIGIEKTAQNVHDRNLLRQTIKFINTFNAKTISPDALKKHREKLDQDPHCAEEELGRVIVLLNSNIDLKKSEILAKFYRAYICEKIDWLMFCELSDATSRLFVSDLEILYDVYKEKISDTLHCPRYKADRLISLGLLDSAMKRMNSKITERYISANDFGKIYCKLGLD